MGSDFRVIVATAAAFVTLLGAFATIHGLLYDHEVFMDGGVIAVICGIFLVVAMLSPWSGDKHS